MIPRSIRAVQSPALAALSLCGLAGLLRAGDFNGDGFDDLAVGVPGEAVNNIHGGIVSVLYGTGNGINATATPNQIFHQDSSFVPDTVEAGDGFGTTCIAGDFNGDGFDDLAVGVPDEDVTVGGVNQFNAGVVTVIFGRPNVGLQTTQAGFRPQQLQSDHVASNRRFGAILAVGDFNDDGFDDLAVGIPGEPVNGRNMAGAVHVFPGSPTGLSASTRQVWTQDTAGILDVAEAGDLFGSALAASDLSGDAADELAIGVPGENGTVGAVQVIGGFAGFGLGSAGNLLLRQGVGGMPGVAASGDRFGLSLAALRDARSGLAIGSPGDNDSPQRSGSVTYLPRGLAAASAVFITQNLISGFATPTSADAFGATLVVSDFGKTTLQGAFLDLAIGAPGATVLRNGVAVIGAGVVFVLHGTSATSFNFAGRLLLAQGNGGLPDLPETADNFGAALNIGNFGKDSLQDLVIGAGREDSGLVDTGVVHVLYGSLSSGLRTTGNQLWSQDSTGVLEEAETGDRFGTAVSGR